MRINPPKRILLAALCCAVCWGCGPAGGGNAPNLIPVKGKVTYKGKPLAKGMIKFHSDGFGRDARGKIESDGTFVLTTNTQGDGVAAGEHRISITELDNSLAKDRALKKYASPNTSRLTVTVDADHTEHTFDLQ
jgi:adhesin HecA-like repeat protein